jgi:hypothetical protein
MGRKKNRQEVETEGQKTYQEQGTCTGLVQQVVPRKLRSGPLG